MIVNQANISAIVINLKTVFNKAFVGSPSTWQQYAMLVLSATNQEDYSWLSGQYVETGGVVPRCRGFWERGDRGRIGKRWWWSKCGVPTLRLRMMAGMAGIILNDVVVSRQVGGVDVGRAIGYAGFRYPSRIPGPNNAKPDAV